MPNHFHLLLKQSKKMGIDNFMESLGTRYTMYFNKKYKRVGALCQAVYKAVLVDNDEQLLYLSSYIHQNPLSKSYHKKQNILPYLLNQPTSLPEYLGKRQTEWLNPKPILEFFSNENPNLNYENFIAQNNDFSPIKSQLIDH